MERGTRYHHPPSRSKIKIYLGSFCTSLNCCRASSRQIVRKLHLHFLITNDVLVETYLTKMFHWPWTLKEGFLRNSTSSKQTKLQHVWLQLVLGCCHRGPALLIHERCAVSKKLHHFAQVKKFPIDQNKLAYHSGPVSPPGVEAPHGQKYSLWSTQRVFSSKWLNKL